MIGRRRVVVLALLASVAPFLPVAAAEAPLEIGIFPYLSIRTLLERHQPLREHLEKSLGRPVTFVTAPDFRSFVQRTQAREFAVAVTAPHFARLAQIDAGYRPMIHPAAPLRGVFLVRDQDGPRHMAELRGTTIATPDRLAVVTMMGEEALALAGLTVPRDARLAPQPSHNAAALAVVRGEATAALLSQYVLNLLDPDLRSRLRVLGTTAELPAPMAWMAAPQLPAAQVAALSKAVLDFAGTEAGRQFMATMGYQGMEALDEDEMRRADPYLPALRRALAETS
ncbi:MAG: phosphate/phosphite/phosphonate ABC transporter substrate-binding protein [Actinomycetota bacterium]